jgi:hypothetical protein
MRDDRPNFELDANARFPGAFGEASGIVAQDFVFAYVYEQGRKTFEIGIKRRGERVARVCSAQIIAGTWTNVGSIKHGTAGRVRADRVTRRSQIRPGRKKNRTCGERSACFTKREQQRQGQSAAGGISRDYDASRGMTFGEEAAVGGNRVINGGGKLIFWREAVIRSQYSQTMKGEANSDGAMGLR